MVGDTLSIQGMGNLPSVATFQSWNRFQESRGGWDAEVILATRESWLSDCPCSHSEPGAWCNYDCETRLAHWAGTLCRGGSAKREFLDAPLRKGFITADMAFLAGLAALAGFGVTAS